MASTPLVSRQVNERELSVQLLLLPQNDLEHGVAAGRVAVGRGLTRSPGGGRGGPVFRAGDPVQRKAREYANMFTLVWNWVFRVNA